MRTAEQWLTDPGESAAWCDTPEDVVRRIQREAFLAGAQAQQFETLQRADVVVAALALPQVVVHTGAMRACARAVDPEQTAERRFGQVLPVQPLAWALVNEAPAEIHPEDQCPRCEGKGDIDHGDAGLIACFDCGGTGRA